MIEWMAVMRKRLPEETAEEYIRSLAAEHGVTDVGDRYSALARTFTSLSGDNVELDSVERILIALKRKGVLDKSEILELQSKYLKEMKEGI